MKFTKLWIFFSCLLPVFSMAEETQLLKYGDYWIYSRKTFRAGKEPEVLYGQFRSFGVNAGKVFIAMSATPERSKIFDEKFNPPFTPTGQFEDKCVFDVTLLGSLSTENMCASPLHTGMQWTRKGFGRDTLKNCSYTVLGAEDIKVGAGVFRAVKINEHCEDPIMEAGTERASKRVVNGVYWYAPAAKAMVKIEHEYFGLSDKPDVADTMELEAFGNGSVSAHGHP
ncbi:MAG: hypothetical protein JO269_04565 [Burkholderiaceae bacterium]|nr:hypothetical protein [Burkholderiaceae bacterium]